MSAWRNSTTSLLQAFTPSFSWRARPVGAVTSRTVGTLAQQAWTMGMVGSVLPPSLTIISSKSKATVRVSVRAMVEDSFRVGMMTAIIIEVYRSGVFGSLNMKYMTTTTVVQKTTCLCQKSTSP